MLTNSNSNNSINNTIYMHMYMTICTSEYSYTYTYIYFFSLPTNKIKLFKSIEREFDIGRSRGCSGQPNVSGPGSHCDRERHARRGDSKERKDHEE